MNIDANMVERVKGVVKWPDPVLRTACKEISTPFLIEGLAERMRTVMRANSGLGLAAPQVGIPARMFIWAVDLDSGVVVNPSLEEPEGEAAMTEGCLSLPGVAVAVNRAESVTLVGLTASGEPLRLRGSGLLARVWQHELDHLNGLTLAERMTETETGGMMSRRAIKRLKVDYRNSQKKKKKGKGKR